MTTLENIMRMLNKNADDKKSVNNDLINQLINELPSGVGIYELRGEVAYQIYLNDGFYRMLNDTREKRKEKKMYRK
ncbi:MAG: hypothetical protein PHS74_09670 [Lachnospiraceae bacterium]|nr:hypothetical protein [Lachnospiraceae bacterium]